MRRPVDTPEGWMMANPPKAQGTRRERLTKEHGRERGLDVVRSENNATGRDLDVRADLLRIVECKDRKQLNPHKAVKKSIENHPGHPVALVFHRTSVKEGNTRKSPDGPTLACLPEGDWWDLVAVVDAAGRLVRGGGEVAFEDLIEAVDRIREKYYPEEDRYE